MGTPLTRLKRPIRHLRHLGPRQYARYLRAPHNAPVPVSIGGTTVHVRRGTPDLGVAITSLTGEFETLRTVQPADYSGVIVDAGGYIGTAAIALSRMFPAARVVTIEPDPDNLEMLRRNVAPCPNIRVVHGALVVRGGTDVALLDRGTGNWGFSIAGAPRDAAVRARVPTVDLAGLGVDPAEIGILKLDIEGGEYALLTQAAPVLQPIGAIFIELHDRIVAGCSEAFFAFSADRTVIRDGGEKYLSLRA